MTTVVPGPKRQPLYWWLLRLRYVRPNSWQRGVLFEGSLATAAILVLADLASAWLLIVLPVAVALTVKAHDLLTGLLVPSGAQPVERAVPSDEDEDSELSEPPE